ncbi:MAG: HAD-IC family P-type ATPase [Patescibacteria group bacterium]|nr:HAD-IC family P-type ATPase [Patescibacteria group bacterium]
MHLKHTGLTYKQARNLLAKFGPNILPESPPPSNFSIFVSQLANPLIYVLIFASILTFFLQKYNDTLIILLAILINTILSFFQEKRAANSLNALKKLINPQSIVVRDGKEIKIKSSEIVPGDVVVVNQGERIPADGIFLEANRVFVNESMLTGESVPISKETGSECFMGTILTAGRGIIKVLKTGKNTKMGAIALEIQEPHEETPLKKQLTKFATQLVFLILTLTAFVFVIGILKGNDIKTMLMTSVALAVSAIPEGLLVGLTVILAISMQRILKKKGLVKRLLSAETLGGVTTICLDKTGTITKGVLQVVDVFGDKKEIALQAVVANDLDDPIVISLYEWSKSHIGNHSDLIAKYQRLDTVPFSSEIRYSASLVSWDEKHNMIFVNGAPDYLIKWADLSKKDIENWHLRINELTSKGIRVIGMARKKVDKKVSKIKHEFVISNLEWVGLIAFTDPVRLDVSRSIAKAINAGIRIIVITGDYAQTAKFVMKQIGVEVYEDEVITGEELDDLSEEELARKIRKVKLFARTTPDQKLKIVEALKAAGEVVAMMGDGVNDAPALNRADIGIVVGEATDVAKESADLVLLDSRFETVIAAIEEGRVVYDNLRKVIIYLMSSAFNAITAVLGALIVGLPIPVTAGQILWINLVTNGFPGLALTIDAKHKGIMHDPPRSAKEPLVAGWMKVIIGIVSVTSGIFSLALFYWEYIQTGDLRLAQSIAYLSLGANSLIYVFAVRSLARPVWDQNFLENKWLLFAVLAGWLILFLPLATDDLRSFFGIVFVPFNYWFTIFAFTLGIIFVIEILKFFYRKFA